MEEQKIAIYCIEGGIGTGKTITGVWFILEELFKENKTIYTNTYLKHIPKQYKSNINYLTKEYITNIFEKVKNKEIRMENSCVFIQEAHNYCDSRNSQSKTNKTIGYWILQSRHTGQGSCDIFYDTQAIGQVDLRLRRNTDYIIHPNIIQWDVTYHNNGKIKKKIPKLIRLDIFTKLGHQDVQFTQIINVFDIVNKYDTHELVDF